MYLRENTHSQPKTVSVAPSSVKDSILHLISNYALLFALQWWLTSAVENYHQPPFPLWGIKGAGCQPTPPPQNLTAFHLSSGEGCGEKLSTSKHCSETKELTLLYIFLAVCICGSAPALLATCQSLCRQHPALSSQTSGTFGRSSLPDTSFWHIFLNRKCGQSKTMVGGELLFNHYWTKSRL